MKSIIKKLYHMGYFLKYLSPQTNDFPKHPNRIAKH
jgi:hypothetical protein